MRLPASARAPLRIFVVSRLVVFAAATFAALSFSPPAGGMDPLARGGAFGGWPAAGLFRIAFWPLVHFDANGFLAVAQHGYAPHSSAQYLFPLYPLTIWLASALAVSPSILIIVSQLVSLAAFAAALVGLHRLTALDVGPQYATPATALLAFYPASFFFSAPYSESILLATSIGAFYAARRERWALAGVLAGLASAARIVGAALIVPLAVMYLYGPRDRPSIQPRRRLSPRYPLRPDIAWLAVAPAGVVAYSTYLGLRFGDALGWLHAQQREWNRRFVGPVTALWHGAERAGKGFLDLTHAGAPVGHTAYPPLSFAAINVLLFVFAVAALVAVAGAFRRLPLAYATWAAIGVLIPLSSPVQGGTVPLASFERYSAVVFPLFMWLGVRCADARRTSAVVACSAAALALLTAQFATTYLWL